LTDARDSPNHIYEEIHIMSKLDAGTKVTLTLLAALTAVVLAALTAVVPLAARAAQADATVSRRVSYAGIDLNTPQGAHTVYFHLKSAARALCTGSDPVYTAPSWVYRECIEDALAKVIRNAHRPLMSQAFVSDYGMKVAAQLGVDTGTRVAKQ
jgi:UrcA family protein